MKIENTYFEQSKESANGRKIIYGLLSNIFLTKPSHNLLRELWTSETLSILVELGFSIDALSFHGKEEEFIYELGQEFNILFIENNGFYVFPYKSESFYFEKSSTTKVGSFYKRSLSSMMKIIQLNEQKVSYDHIGVELHFMELLAEQEKKAWEKGNDDEAFRYGEIQKKFLRKHLGRWTYLFCKKVISFVSRPFYAEFAKLTNRFIKYEMLAMDIENTNFKITERRRHGYNERK